MKQISQRNRFVAGEAKAIACTGRRMLGGFPPRGRHTQSPKTRSSVGSGGKKMTTLAGTTQGPGQGEDAGAPSFGASLVVAHVGLKRADSVANASTVTFNPNAHIKMVNRSRKVPR